MRDYTAAGFEPGAFWGLTPRLLTIHLEGAAKRLQRERELVWFSAMLPHLQKTIPLERFVGLPEDRHDRVKRFHAAWDRIDRALARH
ncbi:hypothetical protein [Rhodobacter lacus]|uniref:Uncharacterized protein n=1 Tax=Rhodobacter lacus TaxID=1641972 RepID=A0ABW5A6N1_9RHOB